jgi:uncharacterized protein YeaO (DUF488 family)
MTIKVKRAYEPPAPEDGIRALVDRHWPRGVRKDQLALREWTKEIAPSRDLISWFGHNPARWDEFQQRYAQELDRPEAQATLDQLRAWAQSGQLTLVYGARDQKHNNAVVLAQYLQR